MDNNTTSSPNGVSRRHVSTEETDDEEVKRRIEIWDEGKGIYVAATDPQFIEIVKEGSNESNSTGTSGSTSGGTRINTEKAITKAVMDLIKEDLITVGAKDQNEKIKQKKEAKTQQAKKPQASKREDNERQ